MQVTDELINKLAHLSRLEYTEVEKKEIREDLERMIRFVEKLDELDLEGVEPLLHISEENNVLREDVVSGMVSRTDALRNAPLHDGVFIKVPKVLVNPSKNKE